MKNYLVLIQNSKRDSILNDKDKFEYYKSWGKYLSTFADDKVINGGPIGKEDFSLTAKTGQFVEMTKNENSLNGYLILKADTIDELKGDLLNCPVFENIYSKMTIHEIDLKATI